MNSGFGILSSIRAVGLTSSKTSLPKPTYDESKHRIKHTPTIPPSVTKWHLVACRSARGCHTRECDTRGCSTRARARTWPGAGAGSRWAVVGSDVIEDVEQVG